MFFVPNAIFIQTESFTPADSVWRPIAFSIICLISCYNIYWSPIYLHSIQWHEWVLGSFNVNMILMFFDRLLLKGFAFGPGLPGPNDLPDRKIGNAYENFIKEKKKNPALTETAARRKFGEVEAGLGRNIGTVWEVKNIPHFSNEDHSYVPSASSFMPRSAVSVAVCYILQKFVTETLVKDAKHSQYIAASYISFFSRIESVSANELFFRVWVSLAFWASLYLCLRISYDVTSILNVAFKVEPVRIRRPFFGSVFLSYTLCNFWG
jgi:hypothetical protein